GRRGRGPDRLAGPAGRRAGRVRVDRRRPSAEPVERRADAALRRGHGRAFRRWRTARGGAGRRRRPAFRWRGRHPRDGGNPGPGCGAGVHRTGPRLLPGGARLPGAGDRPDRGLRPRRRAGVGCGLRPPHRGRGRALRDARGPRRHPERGGSGAVAGPDRLGADAPPAPPGRDHRRGRGVGLGPGGAGGARVRARRRGGGVAGASRRGRPAGVACAEGVDAGMGELADRPRGRRRRRGLREVLEDRRTRADDAPLPASAAAGGHDRREL
ncbi:MAG: Enoyl-CoA hydratase, partial [uncultured Acetobacteraceae bacterium]